MNYFKDGKNWVIAFAVSLIILLVNIVAAPKIYGWTGANVTTQQATVASLIFFLARIVLFYLALLWRLLWNNWKAQK